jgi:hypothetical protein
MSECEGTHARHKFSKRKIEKSCFIVFFVIPRTKVDNLCETAKQVIADEMGKNEFVKFFVKFFSWQKAKKSCNFAPKFAKDQLLTF